VISPVLLLLAAAATTPAPSPPLRIDPTGPPAASYRTGGPLTPGQRHLQEVLRAAGITARLDPCLCRTAQAWARILPSEQAPDYPMASLEFLLHHSGCPDATASATVLFTTEDGTGEATARLKQLLAGSELRHTTDLGIARVAASTPPYRWRWGLLFVRRRFSLHPFPTRLDPGERAPLQMTLDPRLARPRIILLHPDGRTVERDAPRSGGLVACTVEAGRTSGRLWVEIVADGDHGPEIVALFPVAIGQAPPTRWTGKPVNPETAISGPADAEKLLSRLVDEDRSAHGLPPIVRDPALDAVARAHSLDMASSRYLGHRSPSAGGLAERLAAVKYRFVWAGENVARAGSIREAEEALMRSPGHRANILSPRAERLGVGVASGPGDNRWFVTQIFARPAADLDAGEWRRAILSRYRALRERAGGSHLLRWPGLQEAADEAAHRLAAGQEEMGTLVGIAMEKLEGHKAVPVHLELRAARLWRPEEMPWTREDTTGPDAVAVGVAPGTESTDPVALVVLLAYGRPAAP